MYEIILVKPINDYYMTVILLNVYYYLLPFSTLMVLLLIFKSKSLPYIDVLSKFSKSNKLRLFLLYTLFNIGGTPPTSLFLIKSANIYYSTKESYSLISVLIIILSLVSIVFYTQFVRFVYKGYSKLTIRALSFTPYLSYNLVGLIMVLSSVVTVLLFISYDSTIIFNVTSVS